MSTSTDRVPDDFAPAHRSPGDLAPDDLRNLRPSWDLSLAALNRSKNTRAAYMESLRQLIDFLAANGMPITAGTITREHIEAFLADLAERRSPATVHKRYMALRVFFDWVVEEGERTASPMQNMKPPSVPEKPVPVVDDSALKKLLGAFAS